MNRRRGAQWCLSMHPPAGDRSASAYVPSSFRSMWGFRVFKLILQLVKRTSLSSLFGFASSPGTIGLPFHEGHSVRPGECIAAKTPLTSQAGGTLTVRSILGRPR
jgi:hypothetical protein